MHLICRGITALVLLLLVVIAYDVLVYFGFDIILFLIFLVLANLLLDEFWHNSMEECDDVNQKRMNKKN